MEVMMKRWWLLAPAAVFAACATPGTMRTDASPDQVYRGQAESTLTSLDCARRTASRHGYQVWWDGATEGTLRAEQRFHEGQTGATRGYITVSVPHDPGTVMYVTAERIQEGTISGVLNPSPRPGPMPTPVPTGRRTGPRRVSPGEVAGHARNLLSHCGMRILYEQRP
jgi:hypothetical protein